MLMGEQEKLPEGGEGGREFGEKKERLGEKEIEGGWGDFGEICCWMIR